MERIEAWFDRLMEGEFALLLTGGARIVVILVLAALALIVVRRLIRTMRLVLSGRAESTDDVKRIETIAQVFRYLAAVVVSIVAGMLILAEVGVSIAPILGAAGVVGIAVGFGAQSLIKDYFTGFFILLENQIRQGDVVTVAGIGGLVERITLRHLQLRDWEGNVHYVPNGLITTVTNRGRVFSYAKIEVGVAYRESVDEAFEAIRRVSADLRATENFGPRILEDVEVAGVEDWGDSAVVVRARIKVKPLEQWGVRREYLRRLKAAFEEAGIEIPYPHLTLYPGVNKDGSAPALHVHNEAPTGARAER